MFLPFTFVLTLALAGSDEARSESFPTPYNTEPATSQAWTPEEALQSMKLPKGFCATMFAAEPAVQQPIAFAFDERGRLWVVECYTYAEGAKNFDVALHDRILIFEDSDGDGVHDRRTVFWDKGRKLTSVAIGLGGVWALSAPHLLFIPDRNRDDIPDGPPEVVLDGWKESGIRHNIVNGLKWGPDGWLYGRQGILETSKVGPPGAGDSQRASINCGVWRYHPLRKKIEVVLDGTTNPWGFDYDERGEMFISNTVIGHLWHVIPGSRTLRMYGSDPHPRTYGLMTATSDHVHWDTGEVWSDIRRGMSDSTSAAGGGHAHCGLMIYQGDNWPSEYRGKAFMINFHGRRINVDRLERLGVRIVARHELDLIFWQDPWFRGIDLGSGPDGGVYVLDWSDTGECHEQDGIHRQSGRIYKITYGAPAPREPFDLATAPIDELAKLSVKGNDWQVRQARRVLRDRAVAGEDMTTAKESLDADLLGKNDAVHRLRALWGLEAIGAANEQLLISQLSGMEEVRVWAIRLLTDRWSVDEPPSPASIEAITKQAKDDESGLAQIYLASAIQRLPIRMRWELAETLAKRTDFPNNRTLSLLIWYGAEPALPTDQRRAIQFVRECQFPLVRQFVARRAAEEIETSPEWTAEMIDRLEGPALRDCVFGMAAGLRGWAHAPEPANWHKVRSTFANHEGEIKQAMLDLGVVFGDGRSIAQLRSNVTKGPIEHRLESMRALAAAKNPDDVTLFLRLLDDREARGEAIRALSQYNDPRIPPALLDRWNRWDEDERASVVATLSSRPAYAGKLLEALRSGKVDRSSISAYQARQIMSFGDAALTKLLREHWGEIRETAEARRELMALLKRSLSGEKLASADLRRGRATFQKNCATCHILFGAGRRLGPDLTGSNRKNLDYLVENIVTPSSIVAADFRASIVATADGRVLTGFIAEANDRTILLKTNQEDLLLDRKEIERIEPTSNSPMPDGLLENLSNDDVCNLIAYLIGDGQVPLPE